MLTLIIGILIALSYQSSFDWWHGVSDILLIARIHYQILTEFEFRVAILDGIDVWPQIPAEYGPPRGGGHH